MLPTLLNSTDLNEIKRGLKEVNQDSEAYKSFFGETMMLESFVEGISSLSIAELIQQINSKKELTIAGKSLGSLLPLLKRYLNVEHLTFIGSDLTKIPHQICALPPLKSIRFIDGSLEDCSLPKNLDLSNLEELHFDNNQIKSIPSTICLPQLKILSLKQNDITEIPEEIKHLQCLTHLYLEENPIQEISPQLAFLNQWEWLVGGEQLEVQQVSDYYLLYIHVIYPLQKHLVQEYRASNIAQVKRKIALKHTLEINPNKLVLLPLLQYFEAIKILKIKQVNYNSIRQYLKDLTQLRSITLKGSKLNNIPIELSELPNLDYLEICDDQIANTQNLTLFANLKSLNLNHCNLTIFPKEIAHLTQLTHCELNNNEIQQIPPESWNKNDKLVFLKMRNNKLSAIIDLPAALEGVDFSNNQITAFCEGQLPSQTQKELLHSIDLSNNLLQAPPRFLKEFHHTTYHLEGNQF